MFTFNPDNRIRTGFQMIYNSGRFEWHQAVSTQLKSKHEEFLDRINRIYRMKRD